MSFLVSHDIPLSRQTVDAWKENGGVVLKRHRNIAFIQDYLDRHPDTEFVLNLGSAVSATINPDIPVINHNRVVSPLWDPGSTRERFDSVLPPRPPIGHTDWWSKSVGRAGRGKQRISFPYAGDDGLGSDRDVQVHIDGQEYRIVTVGERIVQQFARFGPNGDRRYSWLPREEIPNEITDVVARATRELGSYTLIAWDTILGADGAYVLEGNCCPGVKTYTATRIVKAVRRLVHANT